MARIWTMRLWKKYKPLWLVLLVWALLAALFLIWFTFQLLDLRGGFDKISPLYEEIIDVKEINEIVLRADGVRLEFGESPHLGNAKIQIYGEGYIGQKITWGQQDDVLEIQYGAYPVTANVFGLHTTPDVTLRVLLPAQHYRKVSIEGNWLDGAFRQLQADDMLIQVGHGTVSVDRGAVKRMEVATWDAEVEIKKLEANRLRLSNAEGNTTMEDNALSYWIYENTRGSLYIWNKQAEGIWQLHSRYGDVQLETRKTPKDLLLDLSMPRGNGQITYEDEDWTRLRADVPSMEVLQASFGKGTNQLMIHVEEGSVRMGSAGMKK